MSAGLRAALGRRVLLFDGAMGTLLHELAARPDGCAPTGAECVDALCLTQPELVTRAHESYLAAGCDAIETNTFCANPLYLEYFGLAHRARELNEAAARLARSAADRHATAARPRFVLGAVGPGGPLPSLGEADYAALRASYLEQMRGLLAGGVDALLIETCQDLLQVKAAVRAALDAREEAGRDVLLFVSLTMEVTGTMRVGTELEAAIAALEPLPIDALGLNCATGPREMGEHVRVLGARCRRHIGVYPNAGLPQTVAGKLTYPLSPSELADWMERFVVEDGLDFVGGCCGTTPEHMRVLAARLAALPPRPSLARPELPPSGLQLTGLRRTLTLADSSRPVFVGDVGDASDAVGSRATGRRRLAAGCELLRVTAATAGEMRSAVQHLRRELESPLLLSSDRPAALEAGLELIGGRSIIGPVDLVDLVRCDRVLELAERHGAAVLVRTVDEHGPARSAEDMLGLARRSIQRCLRPTEPGGPPRLLERDVVVEFVVAPLGASDTRPDLAREVLLALHALHETFPAVSSLLDLPALTHALPDSLTLALNAVFLDRARRAGLGFAVAGAAAVEDVERLQPRARELAEAFLDEPVAGAQEPMDALRAYCERRPLLMRPATRIATVPGDKREQAPRPTRSGPRAVAAADAWPTPPFLGPRVVERIALQSIVPYIDQEALFRFHWGYTRRGASAEDDRKRLSEEVRPLFFELAARCEREGILEPRASYGYFRCVREGDTLALLSPPAPGARAGADPEVLARLSFPRQPDKQRRCIADLFEGRGGEPDVVALQVVTIGPAATRAAREWYGAGRHSDSRHLQGLSVEAADAVAEYVHRQIRGELGIARDDARELRDLFKQGYRGCRFTFGEPACPDSSGLARVLELLRADELGVHLDQEGRLWPEHSSAALVSHHPEAGFFTL